MKTTPKQQRHKSDQARGTPREFLAAVERRFGPLALDLAANAANAVCEFWLGPGSEHPDALDRGLDWSGPGLRWLNPPFEHAGKFAARAAEYRLKCTIAMLSPASVGSDWFRHHVFHKALVLALSPRIVFVGEEHGYPKDLMLSVYRPLVAPGFDCWRWKP